MIEVIFRAALGLAAIAALGACGSKVDLKPALGQKPLPVAAGQTKPQTAAELTKPGADAKPARSDELLKRSEKRPTDEFDLPPPG